MDVEKSCSALQRNINFDIHSFEEGNKLSSMMNSKSTVYRFQVHYHLHSHILLKFRAKLEKKHTVFVKRVANPVLIVETRWTCMDQENFVMHTLSYGFCFYYQVLSAGLTSINYTRRKKSCEHSLRFYCEYGDCFLYTNELFGWIWIRFIFFQTQKIQWIDTKKRHGEF